MKKYLSIIQQNNGIKNQKRLIEDDRYFNDKYQGIPKEGYTRNIKIMLNTDFKEVIKIDQDKCENEI